MALRKRWEAVLGERGGLRSVRLLNRGIGDVFFLFFNERKVVCGFFAEGLGRVLGSLPDLSVGALKRSGAACLRLRWTDATLLNCLL